MELCKRVVIFFTFLSFSVGIAFICASLATEYWIEAAPAINPGKTQSPSEKTPTVEGTNENSVNSGVFAGTRRLNWGLGVRIYRFNVKEEIEEQKSFMSLGIWISVLVFAALAVLWAIFGVIFALVNTVIKPIETVAGPLGLYLWNSLAAFCVFASILLFLIQYYTSITHSVLLEEHEKLGFTSEGRTWLSHSFWLMVGALICFGLNIVLLLSSGLETKTRYPARDKEMPQIADGGVLMY